MKRPATQQERVERSRPDAVVALELIARGDKDDGRYDDLLKLALQDYRLRYPGCPAKQPWLFYDGDPKTKRIAVDRAGAPRAGRVDVYCLFCRVLLVHPAVWQYDYSHQLRSHTTTCALRSLAGLMTPGAPGTYRAPKEL